MTSILPELRKGSGQKAIDEQIVRMRATAWFNTAAACFNLSRYTEARQYAMHVTDDPQFGDRARDLLARLPAGSGAGSP
jgi:hypothetical protein